MKTMSIDKSRLSARAFSPLQQNRALTPFAWLLTVPRARFSACRLAMKSFSMRLVCARALGLRVSVLALAAGLVFASCAFVLVACWFSFPVPPPEL